MPKISRCKCGHFMYDEFCVQQGMLYGSTYGKKFVTNGNLNAHGNYCVYWQSTNEYMETVWTKASLTFAENPVLFSAISKASGRRDIIGLSLNYQTSAELEQTRWARDEQHRHFQDHIPFAAPKIVACANLSGSVKHNSSKERNLLTQRPNTVKYVYEHKVTVI